MVQKLLSLVSVVNADPTLVLKVVKIEVFGSYNTDAETLGDIDLFITWEHKDPPDGMEFCDWCEKLAEESGRTFSWHYEKRFRWAPEEAMRRLRGRNPYLSFHWEPDRKLGMKTRCIYPVKGEKE
jgi:predicted nucleotidyltransferase